MAVQLQVRSGTTTEHNTFTGANGEVTVDTTKDVLVVHDGITAGGFPVAARANADGTISLIKKDGTSAGEVNSAGLFNDTLTSTNTNQALTAAQGRLLKDVVDLVGQVYQNLTTSRVKGVLYTNTSGRVRYVCVTGDVTNLQTMTVTVGGVIVNEVTSNGASWGHTVTFIVPIGQTYKVDNTGVIISWSEL